MWFTKPSNATEELNLRDFALQRMLWSVLISNIEAELLSIGTPPRQVNLKYVDGRMLRWKFTKVLTMKRDNLSSSFLLSAIRNDLNEIDLSICFWMLKYPGYISAGINMGHPTKAMNSSVRRVWTLSDKLV